MTNTIFLIATGKYKQFLHQAVRSIERYWTDTEIVIFTDEPTTAILSRQYKIKHEPWPYPTLLRFHYFLSVEKDIKSDYVYYMDVDARWVDIPDVKGDLVGTLHCGYYFPEHRKADPPVEQNRKSIFYRYQFEKYYGGGFFGGIKDGFFDLCAWCKGMIDNDLENGIIPINHDETALNAYFTGIHSPTLELTPDYHYPENTEYFINNCWGGKNPFKPKLLLLNKDHDRLRSSILPEKP